MIGSASIRGLALVALLAGSSATVAAHDGMREQIVAASRRIAREPRDAALYLARGELYRVVRSWSRAARDYDRAQGLDPSLAAVHFARGRMLFESGRARDARRELDRYLALEPDDAAALVERARVFVLLIRPRDAVADYTRAIELLPNPEPDVYVERANAQVDAGRADAAVAGLDEGMARLGRLVSLGLHAIAIERSESRFDAALERIDAFARGAERKESWLVLRGDVLAQAGRAGEARVAYASALDAISRLPYHRRSTRAVAALEARARSGIGESSPESH